MISIDYIKSKNNLEDSLIKGLVRDKVNYLLGEMKLKPMTKKSS